MANLVPKVPAAQWLAHAREVLIDEGIDAVKVDRLAQRIGVSRGGFYHHFADRAALLNGLLEDWALRSEFVPKDLVPRSATEAREAIDTLVHHLVSEERYDARFDMAVRAWAHSDPIANKAVRRSDQRRLAAIRQIFLVLGCEEEEALVRARVFYFHQIGYYEIGLKESRAERSKHVQTYVRILCGERHFDSAPVAHGPNGSAPKANGAADSIAPAPRR